MAQTTAAALIRRLPERAGGRDMPRRAPFVAARSDVGETGRSGDHKGRPYGFFLGMPVGGRPLGRRVWDTVGDKNRRSRIKARSLV